MVHQVTPCVGVWIEIFQIRFFSMLNLSLPAWECGLKCKNYQSELFLLLSLPAWECGLKLKTMLQLLKKQTVTPCVGVWIEIV